MTAGSRPLTFGVEWRRGVQFYLPLYLSLIPDEVKPHPFDKKLQADGYTQDEIREVNEFMKERYPDEWPVKVTKTLPEIDKSKLERF